MSFKHYYVNKNAQSNGDHEVHAEGCSYLPEVSNRDYLGYYSNWSSAVNTGKVQGIYPGKWLLLVRKGMPYFVKKYL